MLDDTGRPDPGLARTAAEFVGAMRQLKQWTGLGFRLLERRAEAAGESLPRSTLTAVLSRTTLPREDLVVALARTCGCTKDEVERWVAVRRRIAASRPTAEPPGPTVVPAQLPPPIADFVGRVRHLDDLDGRSSGVTVITGTAGVGKTTLAVHWAHQVADRFPDGQLYLNLRGFGPHGAAMSSATAVRALLDALDVSPHRVPTDLDGQVGLYRSLTAGRRLLVVLDNARDTEQVRHLLPGGPGCLAIVTSRDPLGGLVALDGARPFALDLLSTQEARDLLTSRLGPERVAAEPGAIEEIIVRCSRLPLALAVAAARAAIQPQLPLAAVARDLRHALDALAGVDPATDLRAVFSWSYNQLSPSASRLFRLLGLHPGPDISLSAAASLAALPRAGVRSVLTELTRAHLVAEPTPGRYAFHDLLRAYAAEMVKHTDSAEAAIRMLDHYLHSAYAGALLLHPYRDPLTLAPLQPGTTPEVPAGHEQALAWFAAEHSVLLAVIDRAAELGRDTHAWQLASAFSTYLDRRGCWQDQAVIGRTALAASRRSADPTAQARAHRSFARACRRLGQFDKAHHHLHQALDLHRQTGDRTGEADAHHNLAIAWAAQGRNAEALQHSQRALGLYRSAGHRAGEGQALNAVGWYHARLGSYELALVYCRQALELLRETDHRFGMAETWDSVGYAHHHLGQHAEAIGSFERALHLWRDLDDRYSEADILTQMGDTHHASGNLAAARTVWRQALTILDDLDHPDADKVRGKL